MMSGEHYMVNGHVLPGQLVEAIRAGWVEHIDKDAAANRLGVDCTHLSFFRLDYVLGLLANDWLNLPEEYRGFVSDAATPGDIDPQMSVVFGEVVSDSPLALDFRKSPPSVVAYPWPLWVQIAEDVDDFLEKLDPGRVLRRPSE